jgi:adenosylhomocysteinase
VHPLPDEIDVFVARAKLDALGIRIDALTDAQRTFLASWEAFA